MKKSTAFRPILVPLESRVALSHVPAPVDPAYAASGAYGDTFRQGFAGFYLNKALARKAPILFLGDSTALLWGANSPGPGSGSWSATFAPLGAEEAGILGDQTENILYRIEHGALAGNPGVVVLQVGVNDLLLGAKTPTATAHGLTDDVQAIRQSLPGARVIVVGITPTTYTGLNPLIADTNTLASRRVRQRNVTFLDPGRSFLNSKGALLSGVLGDFVHPSPLGYQILAAQLAGPVRAALRQ